MCCGVHFFGISLSVQRKGTRMICEDATHELPYLRTADLARECTASMVFGKLGGDGSCAHRVGPCLLRPSNVLWKFGGSWWQPASGIAWGLREKRAMHPFTLRMHTVGLGLYSIVQFGTTTLCFYSIPFHQSSCCLQCFWSKIREAVGMVMGWLPSC